MSSRRLAFPILVALPFVAVPAAAQTSAAAPPPSARTEAGDTPKGDPSGALRALGTVDPDHGKAVVKIPDVGGGQDGRTGGVPPGTR